jgi:hypothetical protein
MRIFARLCLLAAILPFPAAAQVYPNVPPNAVLGRVGSDVWGQPQAIPFATLSTALGIAPGGSNGQVQYNNSGSFGGYTATQLTALLNVFTSSLSGVVPASGGGTSNYLRADGTWNSPSTTGFSNVANVYVSSSGTDTGNCQTSGTPCATIAYVLSQLYLSVGNTTINVTGTFGATSFTSCGMMSELIISGGTFTTSTSATPALSFSGGTCYQITGNTISCSGTTCDAIEVHGAARLTVSGSITISGSTLCDLVAGQHNGAPASPGFIHVSAGITLSGNTDAAMCSYYNSAIVVDDETITFSSVPTYSTAVLLAGYNGTITVNASSNWSGSIGGSSGYAAEALALGGIYTGGNSLLSLGSGVETLSGGQVQ